MSESVLALALALLVAGAAGEARGPRYSFYRKLRESGVSTRGAAASRRVFGGETAQLEVFPAACALLDRYWAVRCSGAVVRPRWVLTAAHCIRPRVAYVKYNARRAAGDEGDHAPVDYLYKHPKYEVMEEDEGRGPDVTLLHHDVGLVHTRRRMTLLATLPFDPVAALRNYDAFDLHNQDVEVLGFGHSDAIAVNEELSLVRLELVYCGRGSWFHCMCGVQSRRQRGQGAPGGPSGVCSGDSGGPVLYRGVQVGVTSMGPTECSVGGAAGDGATSVFTSLYRYADFINATISATDSALRMRRLRSAAPPPPRQSAAAARSLAALLPLALTFLAS